MRPYSTAETPRSSFSNLVSRRTIICIPIARRFCPVCNIDILASVNKPLRLKPYVANVPTITVVAAALLNAEGRALLQQRPPGRHMAGLWEFPGGKIEPGELPEAALIRELNEELGIAIDSACLSPATFASASLGEKHLLLLLYICRKWRGTPQPLEASALIWVHPKEMLALPMPPADKPLIGLLDALI